MSGSTIYVSKKSEMRRKSAILQAGRILHDLFEVGPWRINYALLAKIPNQFDFETDKNIFEDFILRDGGNADEFIYRKCGEEIFVIWNKEQTVNLNNFTTWIGPQFRAKLTEIIALLAPNFPELAKFPVDDMKFPLATYPQVEANRQFFPTMPANYGLCLRSGASVLMDLNQHLNDAGSPTSSTKFIIYHLDQKFSGLPLIRDYLAANSDPKYHPCYLDYKKRLLEGDNIRCQLNPYPETMLTDSSQGHWDLYWPDGAKADEKWYEKAELPETFHGRNPAKDIRESSVAIDFGTTGTVVATRAKNGQVSLLRIGAQGERLREGVKPEHFVNPTVISIENAPNLLAAWHDLPWRPEVSWQDVQCSHQAYNELSEKSRSGLAGIKTWARGKCDDEPIILVDRENNDLPLPIPAAQSADSITDDFEELPLNPIELYAFFLGLGLNNQIVDGGRIFTEYYMTFPAKFERETRDRILDGFRRGLLRSLPPSLIYAADWSPAKLKVIERACEPAALAAAILPLLDEDGDRQNDEQIQPENQAILNLIETIRNKINVISDKILKIHDGSLRIGGSSKEAYLKKLYDKRVALQIELDELLRQAGIQPEADKQTAPPRKKPSKPLQPTLEGVPFGVFDFGGGTTDIAIGLYRLPTEEEEDRKNWESVIDILDTSGDADLGGEELVRLMVFEVVRANMAKLLENDVIPFERCANYPYMPGGEELFGKSVIARENSRKLGEKLRPVWHNGDLENTETPGQISETFSSANGAKKPLTLNVDVSGLRAMLKKRIEEGVEKFFSTMGQALKKNDICANVFHIILAGNSSQSNMVEECFRETIGKILEENTTNDKIILHRPLLPDPANPEAITLKTGVAIGLLNVLPGEATGMVNRQQTSDEAAFAFTLGPLKKQKLVPALKRNTPYGEWHAFGKVLDEGVCKFYYSQSPKALEGTLGRGDCLEGRHDWGAENAGKTIVVRAEKPDTVVFGLQDDNGGIIAASEWEYVLK